MSAGYPIVVRYFPDLTALQDNQFRQLEEIYTYWNSRINVISRKDLDMLYERHVLHSLGIAKVVIPAAGIAKGQGFKPGTRVLDVGTGGGFPGIPLAILFPETEFLLVDSIGKKINVVKEVAAFLGLKNVRAEHTRAEHVRVELPQEKFDFVVSRAVADMTEFEGWVRHVFSPISVNALPNGILYMKGGDLTAELKTFNRSCRVYNLSDYFKEEFFETKKLVYLPARTAIYKQ
jgi:16S rRNA (guanine527-N7)-methyltransferase